jgi:hypothetical protein
MIYLAWTIYSLLSLLISLFIRNIFKKTILKKVFFSLALSVFITSWFTFPGSQDIAPIISIFLVNVLENSENTFFRLLRPLGFIFFVILTLDFINGYLKSRN